MLSNGSRVRAPSPTPRSKNSPPTARSRHGLIDLNGLNDLKQSSRSLSLNLFYLVPVFFSATGFLAPKRL